MIGLCRSVKIPARYISGYLPRKAPAHARLMRPSFPVSLGALIQHTTEVDENYVKIGHDGLCESP